MTTYESVHAGDVVLGHDGELWGVQHIAHEPELAVTLVKYGYRVTGRPLPQTEVTIVERADVSKEFQAAELLGAAFGIEIISETWES